MNSHIPQAPALSEREALTLQMICEEKSPLEIAHLLNLSAKTIHITFNALFLKFAVTNKVGLVKYWFSQQSAATIQQLKASYHQPATPLTDNEMKIINLICQAKTLKEIAGEWKIPVKTFYAHCNRLFKKIGVNNLIGLVKFAICTGIAALPNPVPPTPTTTPLSKKLPSRKAVSTAGSGFNTLRLAPYCRRCHLLFRQASSQMVRCLRCGRICRQVTAALLLRLIRKLFKLRAQLRFQRTLKQSLKAQKKSIYAFG